MILFVATLKCVNASKSSVCEEEKERELLCTDTPETVSIQIAREELRTLQLATVSPEAVKLPHVIGTP